MAAIQPGKILSGLSFTPKYDWLLDQDTYMVKTVEIDPDIADAGSGNANLVRSGLVIGFITATKKAIEYDDGASDGSEVAKGILLHPIWKLDAMGNAIVSPVFAAVVLRARVNGSKLVGLDSNGKTDLKTQGFLFDDDLPA